MYYFRKQFTRHWKDHTEIWCDDTWPTVKTWDPEEQIFMFSRPSRTFYYTFISGVLYFAPVTIMLAAYSLIILKLRKTKTPGVQIATENAKKQDNIKKRVSFREYILPLNLLMFIWYNHCN